MWQALSKYQKSVGTYISNVHSHNANCYPVSIENVILKTIRVGIVTKAWKYRKSRGTTVKELCDKK